MHSNRKLIMKAVIVTVGSLGCIFLGLQAWILAYIDWSSHNGLDPSRLLPTVLIPTFLLIVGALSVVNFIRGLREARHACRIRYPPHPSVPAGSVEQTPEPTGVHC